MYKFKIMAATEDSLTETVPLETALPTDYIHPNRLRPSEVVQDRFDAFLFFKDPSDDPLYQNTLKDVFNFNTFLPFFVMIVVVVAEMNVNDGDTLAHMKRSDVVLFISSKVFQFLAMALMMIFTVAQFFNYIHKRASTRIVKFSQYILRRFLGGHIEDLIVLSFALSNGLYLVASVNGGSLCASEGNTFTVHSCSERTSFFPQHQMFCSFAIQMLVPKFLKSTSRFVSILSMAILTIFMIVAVAVGEYKFDVYIFCTAFIFLLGIYEFERFRILSFLLTKEALLAEKRTQDQTKRDAADQLDRRTNQALLQQILPPQVAKQLLSGKQVEPEKFEEVTIFFSDVVGFTDICAQVPPIKVVKMLNELYTVMDYCTAQFPLYKVETIGDAYMVRGSLCINVAVTIMLHVICSIVSGRSADKGS